MMLVMLLPVAAIASGLVLLAVLAARKARWLLPVLLAAGAVGGFCLTGAYWLFASDRQGASARSLHAAAEVERAERLRPSAFAAVCTREASMPVPAVPFLADVYPSPAAAAEALAANLARAVPTVAGERAELPVIRLRGQASAAVLAKAAEALGARSLARRVEIDRASLFEGPSSQPADVVVCEVQADDGERQGAVRMTLRGPGGQASRTARFVSKPWAADPGTYAAADTANTWVFADCGDCRPTLAEAEHGALEDAAAQLMPHVTHAVNREIAAGRLDRRGQAQMRLLGQLLVGELRRGTLVADRFAQRYARPYGDVWRSCLLVNASPKLVDPLALRIGAQIAGREGARVSRGLRGVLSLGGLGLLVLLVYLLLNAATKGYYAGVLRLVAILLAGAGTLLLVMMS